MNERTRLFAALALTAVLTAGCAGTAMKPLSQTVPEDTAPWVAPPPPAPSRMQIEVRVPVADLNRLFDQRLPSEMAVIKDQALALGATASARVVRDGPTEVRTEGGGFAWTVPARIVDGEVLYTWSRTVPLGFGRTKTLDFEKVIPFSAAFKVIGHTKISVNKKWKLRSETTASYQWADELRVVVDLGFKSFELDVSAAADRALRDRMGEMAAQVDAEIARRVDVRDLVERAWRSLGEPVKIRDRPAPLWITAALTRITLPSPAITEDAVVLRPMVTGLVSAHIGSKPAGADPGPLPALRKKAKPGRGLHMTVPVLMTWTDMRALVMQHAGGKEMVLGDGNRVTIHDIAFSRDGDRIRVQVDLNTEKRSGLYVNLDGRVTVTGRPVFDRDEYVLSMEDLSFDLETANLLGKFANWVAHDAFLEAMRKHMRIDVDDRIREVRGLVNQGLKRVRYADLVTLSGRVIGIEPVAPMVSPKGLEMRFHVTAEASLTVE